MGNDAAILISISFFVRNLSLETELEEKEKEILKKEKELAKKDKEISETVKQNEEK